MRTKRLSIALLPDLSIRNGKEPCRGSGLHFSFMAQADLSPWKSSSIFSLCANKSLIRWREYTSSLWIPHERRINSLIQYALRFLELLRNCTTATHVHGIASFRRCWRSRRWTGGSSGTRLCSLVLVLHDEDGVGVYDGVVHTGILDVVFGVRIRRVVPYFSASS